MCCEGFAGECCHGHCGRGPCRKFHHKLLVFKGIMNYRFLKKHFFLILLILGFVTLYSASRAASPLSDIDIVLKLRQLKPLPKVHYSWGLGTLINDPNSKLLYELARITHSIGITGAYVSEEQIVNAVYVCARVDRTNPEIPASIAINLSPFHYKFEKNLGPADRGASFQEELNFLVTRLMLIKSWVGKANAKYSSDVRVTAILFDSERFVRSKTDEKWNSAICDAFETVQQAAVRIFPSARIEWFAQGVEAAWGKDGWGETPFFVHCKMFRALSCIFYTLPEIERMRETFRRTCKLADELGIEEVTPWVALGSGLRRNFNGQNWDSNWDYDLIYSWEFGAELNSKWYSEHPKRFAPFDRARIVAFYPCPFDSRSPNWGKHFIAFVRGANGVRKLDDLE